LNPNFLFDFTRSSARQMMMLPTFPGGKELKQSLIIPKDAFEYRWEAD
jgi:hypothetical protein